MKRLAGWRNGYCGFQPRLWTPTLVKIKTDIEAATGTKFNSVFVILWMNGTSYL